MGTIIQDFGPIYGEVVNGTVQGRPNGSVYVPLSNTIDITIVLESRYIRNSGANLAFCTSTGSTGGNRQVDYVAQAQDLASYVQVQVYSDSDCTDLIASRNLTAGQFNNYVRTIYSVEETIVLGTKYYVRAQLMNNGSAVATSDTIEVTGWASE